MSFRHTLTVCFCVFIFVTAAPASPQEAGLVPNGCATDAAIASATSSPSAAPGMVAAALDDVG